MKTIDVIEKIDRQGGHSIFAPSYSKTITSCPGSLLPGLLLDEQVDSYEAAEGTVAHKVAEQWLTSLQRPDGLVGRELDDVLITVDMLDYLEEYVEWCLELSGEHYIETRVDFSDLTPLENQFGTCDHAACFEGELVVTDLKFGKRILVSPVDNSQILIYAYGFFKLYDSKYNFQQITLRIAQPRMFNFNLIQLTRSEFLAKIEVVKNTFSRSLSSSAPRIPTIDGCEWCKIRSNCGARALQIKSLFNLNPESSSVSGSDMEEFLVELGDQDFKFELTDIYDLSTEHMAKLLLWRKFTDKFFDSIHEELTRRAYDEFEDIPGFEMALGRGVREWKDSDQAIEFLKDLMSESEIVKDQVITPSKTQEHLIENGFSRKEVVKMLDEYVTKRFGPLALRPVSKRKNLRSKIDVDDTEFD